MTVDQMHQLGISGYIRIQIGPLPYPRLEIHQQKTRPAKCWIHGPLHLDFNRPSEIETHHSSIHQIYSK